MDIKISSNGLTAIKNNDFAITNDVLEFLAQLVYIALKTLPGELDSHPSFGIGADRFAGLKNTKRVAKDLKKLIESKLNDMNVALFIVKVTPLDINSIMFSVYASIRNNMVEIARYEITFTAYKSQLKQLFVSEEMSDQNIISETVENKHRIKKNPYVE